jgi:hypothetical protein
MPLRVEVAMISVPRVNLPRGDWSVDNDDWRVGKKFALPEFDRSRQLRVELQQFRAFWIQRIVRNGRAWSNATVEKRASNRL